MKELSVETLRKHGFRLVCGNGLSPVFQVGAVAWPAEVFAAYLVGELITLEQQLSSSDNVVKDLTAQCRSFHTQLSSNKREVVETLDSVDALTINILRLWDRDKIKRFAEHLLGSEYELLVGARRVLDEPYGCPMCHSGSLIDQEKDHFNNCGFRILRKHFKEKP